MSVVIIDYGSGNLHSTAKAFELKAKPLGKKVVVTSDPVALKTASHIVLPGVGAFGDCMAGLERISGMRAALEEEVIKNKKPFLGICVGMQLLAEKGLEHGEHKGLGWLKGQVVPIAPADAALKIPHMGWNNLEIKKTHPLLKDLPKEAHSYFVHSFAMQCANENDVLSTVDYGSSVVAIVAHENIMGTQFHPEKSQETGLKIIENFLKMALPSNGGGRNMILFPAIDLKDGQCVRLLKGDMDKATVFSDDPGAQAKAFEDAGAEWIHIVDLNGAFEGRPVNVEAVRAIIKAVNIPVQLGGGIRGINMIDEWVAEGVSRVILGTVALRHPEIVKEACQLFSGKVAVGIDARDGKVAVEGWAEKSEMDDSELALKFEDAGVAGIIYTNIDKDGMMGGPDVEGTRKLAEKISTPVIASGGVSSMEDLKALKAVEASGVSGVICGRAIYDGKVDIRKAVQLLK